MNKTPIQNCNNCGAPIVDGYCSFCKTRYFYVTPVEIKPEPAKKVTSKKRTKSYFQLFVDDLLVGHILSFEELSHPKILDTTTWGDFYKTSISVLRKPATIKMEVYMNDYNLINNSTEIHNFKIIIDTNAFLFTGYVGDFSFPSCSSDMNQLSLTLIPTGEIRHESIP